MSLRRTMPLLLIGLLLFASTGGALAQDSDPGSPGGGQVALGSGFSYSGRLTSGGAPASGYCDFEFRLYDAASGGAQVGATQTFSSVLVEAGLFTLTLNGAGEFGGSAFNGQARWLAIAVRCPAGGSGEFTHFANRQPVLATPYAGYSLSAPWSGLTGVPAGFADGTDDVGGGGAAWQLISRNRDTNWGEDRTGLWGGHGD